MKNFFAPLKTKFCDSATFKKTAGILLLAIGFVALFLPFVPGILFGILGLELLGTDARIRKKVIDFFTKRRSRSKSS